MAEAPVIRFGCFDGAPEVLRKSTILRRAREKGMHEAAAELERVAAMFPECPHHGKLEDPIVGRVGTQIAICCPWCSDPKVLAAWEAEGRRGVG
jgi:hypothetical protein